MNLIQDQYGNYVIQHVIERGRPQERNMVVNKVKGQISNLSRHKFASNVVEKCFAFASPKDRDELVREIVATKSDGTNALTAMMKDQYANYVVQKMLDVVNVEQRDLLLAKIRPQLQSLRKYTYGKHLIASEFFLLLLIF